MRTPLIALAALGLASLGFGAGAHAAAAPAAKPAAATPAKPAAAAGLKIPNFDARNPDSIVTLLGLLNAKATVAKAENGQVFLNITTEGGGFGAQMIGCDATGKACHAMALFTVYEKKGATLAQINDFNRSQLACRGILAPDGRASVMYSTMVNQRMGADETRLHLGVWQGCLVGFSEFLKDPVAFLSKPH